MGLDLSWVGSTPSLDYERFRKNIHQHQSPPNSSCFWYFIWCVLCASTFRSPRLLEAILPLCPPLLCDFFSNTSAVSWIDLMVDTHLCELRGTPTPRFLRLYHCLIRAVNRHDATVLAPHSRHRDDKTLGIGLGSF